MKVRELKKMLKGIPNNLDTIFEIKVIDEKNLCVQELTAVLDRPAPPTADQPEPQPRKIGF